MSLLQLLILAIVSMIGLAILRVARVHLGRAPLPEGWGKLLFVIAFLVGPPIALQVLIGPAAMEGPLGPAGPVALYVVILASLTILMGIGALIARLVAPGPSLRLLLLALVGTEVNPDDLAIDPPLTAQLAETVALVDSTNEAFPRGPEFSAQIDRAGFRVAWDSLQAATATLEGRIATEHRLGRPVASAATAAAADARSRLETLRSLALGHGQAWAGA